MLTVTSILGNAFRDKEYRFLLDSADVERLKLMRAEIGRNHLRRRTDRGTDVGVSLESGQTLQNGDVLNAHRESRTILVEQLPEKVIAVSPGQDDSREAVFALVGHAVGNRHRPISVQDGIILFPISSDSELSVFRTLFASISDAIELAVECRVFAPHAGADVHEHG